MYYNIQLGDEKMSIEENIFRKFLEDTGLIDQVNNELFVNTYFIDHVGDYNSYLDNAGLNYARKYVCDTKKAIEYNKENMFYLLERKTFSSEDGFSPDNYISNSLISSCPININNELFKVETALPQLYDAIAKKYGITNKLINDYYSGDTIKTNNAVNYLTNIINLYNQINKKEKLINSLNYSISCIHEGINELINNYSYQDEKEKTI